VGASEIVFVDGERPMLSGRSAFRAYPGVFFETPSNPMQSLVDIAAVTELATRSRAKVVLDNVFATPLLQQGFPLGVDVVVYSGNQTHRRQGRVLGGAILGDRNTLTARCRS